METKIIKSAEHPRVINRAAQQAYVEAEHILENARQQAAEIVEAATRNAEAIGQTSSDDGYRAGLACWNDALLKAEQTAETWQRDAEQQLIKLSVRIAEKIIGEQLRMDSATVISIIRQALKSARRESRLTLHVNPDNVQEVRSQLEKLRAESGGVREFRVAGDTKVGLGGCIVESELGTIDARLEVQLQVLEELMLKGKR